MERQELLRRRLEFEQERQQLLHEQAQMLWKRQLLIQEIQDDVDALMVEDLK